MAFSWLVNEGFLLRTSWDGPPSIQSHSCGLSERSSWPYEADDGATWRLEMEIAADGSLYIETSAAGWSP